MLFVGWRSRFHSAETYWVAGRRYGTARIAASLVATIFGASSTMGVIGLGYSRGLTGAWWSLIGGMALIPFGLFLASRVRRLAVVTLPDILKRAYGEKVALPAAAVIALAWCGVIAAQLIAAGRLIEGLFNVDFQVSLAVVAVVFTLYTFWGGQLSVIRTDAWQFGLFMGGLLISLAFLLSSVTDAPAMWESLPPEHLRFPVSRDFGWYQVLVFYPLIVGLPYLVGPDIYSRVLCAADDRVARRAALWSALVVIPVALLLALFGLLARACFPGIAAEAALAGTLNGLVPQGLRGLIAAGFLGAIMSSADTCLISAATILTLNVVGPLRRGSEEAQLRVTRVCVLILGAMAWLVAGRVQGIIASLLMGFTVFVGGVVLPTLASFFQDRLGVTPQGAFWAVILGGGSALLAKIQGGALVKLALGVQGQALLLQLLGPQYLSLLPIVLCLVVLMGVSRVTR
jgi:SSS family solute:Na+ symporter